MAAAAWVGPSAPLKARDWRHPGQGVTAPAQPLLPVATVAVPPRRAAGPSQCRVPVALAALAGTAWWRLRDRRRGLARRALEDDLENPYALALGSQLAELVSLRKGDSGRWEEHAGSRAIVPAGQTPWGIAHFVGGAVLGQFPELCYDSILRPLADRTGIAVVSTPYKLAKDHDFLAFNTYSKFEEALASCRGRYGWDVDRMPRFALGHSLGAKLQVLLACEDRPEVQGVGLLAFNNFGITDSVRLLKEMLETVQGPGSGAMDGMQILETLLRSVKQATGLEFSPSPERMLTMVRQQYGNARRTRLFRFRDDDLDCSSDLLDALAVRGVTGVDEVELPGGHLSPVFIELKDVMRKASSQAPRMANKLSESVAGQSVGDREATEKLLDALVEWIKAV